MSDSTRSTTNLDVNDGAVIAARFLPNAGDGPRVVVVVGTALLLRMTPAAAINLYAALGEQMAQARGAQVHDLAQARGARKRPNGDAA